MDTVDPNLRPMPRQGAVDVAAPLRSLTLNDVRQQALSIPNLLTYLRFLVVPPFVWAFHHHHPALALWLFVGAAITDGLDGFMARVLEQRTRLGSILDPIADKLLVLAAVSTLVVDARLPVWLLVLLLIRDTCIGSAAIILRATGRPVPAAPTRMGKYSTFALAATLALSLVREAEHNEQLTGDIAAFVLLSTQCVIATLVQYFVRWRRLMRVPPSLPRPQLR
jgi:cardiolipin synthase